MFSRLFFRMTAPIVGISLLLLILAGGAAWYVHRLQQETTELLDRSVQSAEAADELVEAIMRLQHRLQMYQESGRPEDIQQARGEARLVRKVLRVYRDQRGHVNGQPVTFRWSKDIDVLVNELAPPHAGADERIGPQSIKEQSAALADLTVQAAENQRRNRQEVEALTDQTQMMTNRVGLTFLLLGVAGASAGLLAGFGIARGVRKSLVELTVPVHTAAGALNAVAGPITVSTSGNIEDLSTSLEDLSMQVADVVDRLQRSQQEALRSEQLAALGQLAAGLAHELRNPLQAMKTLVQGARIDGEDACLDSRDLEVMEEEITRLNTTIQNFLDYARPPKLERRETDVTEIVRKTVQLVSPRAEQQGIVMRAHFDDDLPLLEADPEQLRQVMLNLLLNACDAQCQGGAIDVRVQAVDGQIPDESVRIIVADEGTGLCGELGERIFEPFVSTKDSGTGIGLSICKRIIEDHNGTITAQPREDGQGAEFVITLPAAVAVQA